MSPVCAISLETQAAKLLANLHKINFFEPPDSVAVNPVYFRKKWNGAHVVQNNVVQIDWTAVARRLDDVDEHPVTATMICQYKEVVKDLQVHRARRERHPQQALSNDDICREFGVLQCELQQLHKGQEELRIMLKAALRMLAPPESRFVIDEDHLDSNSSDSR